MAGACQCADNSWQVGGYLRSGADCLKIEIYRDESGFLLLKEGL